MRWRTAHKHRARQVRSARRQLDKAIAQFVADLAETFETMLRNQRAFVIGLAVLGHQLQSAVKVEDQP